MTPDEQIDLLLWQTCEEIVKARKAEAAKWHWVQETFALNERLRRAEVERDLYARHPMGLIQ